MSESQQHAARLREMADNTMLGSCGTPTQSQINDQAALLAGAEALEREAASVTTPYQDRAALHMERMEAAHERIARALEPKPKGRWRITSYNGQFYMIPVEHWAEWLDREPEAGEHTSIVPEWAAPVPPNVVITGWEG